MNTIKTVLFLLMLSLSLSSSAQKPEKKAEKFVTRITKALDLSKEDQKKVYKIQLQRFKDAKAIRSKYKNDNDSQKAELKKLGNRVYNEMKDALGKEQLKKWKDYRKKNKN